MDTIRDKINLEAIESLCGLINFPDTEGEDSIYVLAERAMREVRNKLLPYEWGEKDGTDGRGKKAEADGKEGETEFPVDIRKIIQTAGIPLYEINMNMDIGFQFEKVKGHIRCQENEKWAIFVDIDENEYTKRYIMAHEFCYLLIQEMRESEKPLIGDWGTYYRIDPLFSKNKYELCADMMAAFLMFPYESVLKCMGNYIEELRKKNTYPMDVSGWVSVLERRAQISSYYTIISYQYLKYFLCENYSEIADDEFKRKYERFFR